MGSDFQAVCLYLTLLRLFALSPGWSHSHDTPAAFVVQDFQDFQREKRDYRISSLFDSETRAYRSLSHLATHKVKEREGKLRWSSSGGVRAKEL